MVDHTQSQGIPSRLADLHGLQEWIVELEFYRDGVLCNGTGFFMQVPNSPYDVIFTAGHNLYTNKKTYTNKLTILLPNLDPNYAEPMRVSVPSEHVKVSSAYLSDPTLPEEDYGAILIPRGAPGRAFGYRIISTLDELVKPGAPGGNRSQDSHIVIPHPFQFASLHVLQDWVVKLEFHSDGELSTGSGFFLNIPDASYDVILTAAHNLYSDKKAYTTKLTILLPNPDLTSPKEKRVPVLPSQVQVAAAYISDPTIIEADYGAILIPRAKGAPGRGFGFNMTLAFDQLVGDACVSGYRALTEPGRPTLSMGKFVTCSETQLAYEAKTEQGISGSAVWIMYKYLESFEVAAVAIHNHKPAKEGGGSRGSRLTPKVLGEIFGWVSVVEFKKKICAKSPGKPKKGKPELPHNGLYMVFPEDFAFARLQRGTGAEVDVLPAQVTSSQVVRYTLAMGLQWVLFDTKSKRVVLVDKMTDECLFKKDKHPPKPAIVQIVLSGDIQLKMDGSVFNEWDDDDVLSSGVDMVKYPSNDMFIKFSFE